MWPVAREDEGTKMLHHFGEGEWGGKRGEKGKEGKEERRGGEGRGKERSSLGDMIYFLTERGEGGREFREEEVTVVTLEGEIDRRVREDLVRMGYEKVNVRRLFFIFFFDFLGLGFDFSFLFFSFLFFSFLFFSFLFFSFPLSSSLFQKPVNQKEEEQWDPSSG